MNVRQKMLEDCLKSNDPKDALEKAFKNCVITGGVCGKVLTYNDSGWKCLDCE